MPGRNVVKVFAEDSFYHIYNRGVNKRVIFKTEDDLRYFEWLLERSLGPTVRKDAKGREYTWLRDKVELNAYCLMPNHFHLLIHQSSADGITKLLQSVATAYTGYFNKTYGRRGPLFENSYRAVLVSTDQQLQHVSRYIHLNHREFRIWPHSSLMDYLGNPRAWINPTPILDQFASCAEYRQFTLDYEALQRELDSLKHQLASDGLY